MSGNNKNESIFKRQTNDKHEKGLQRQMGVGTLVSNQERRALFVPVINRCSSAGFVPPSVYMGFCLFVLLGRGGGMFGGYEGGLFPWRTVLLASSSARPCPATPLCPPPRCASGMFGFWIRQVLIACKTNKDVCLHGIRTGRLSILRVPVLPLCPAIRCPVRTKKYSRVLGPTGIFFTPNIWRTQCILNKFDLHFRWRRMHKTISAASDCLWFLPMYIMHLQTSCSHLLKRRR